MVCLRWRPAVCQGAILRLCFKGSHQLLHLPAKHGPGMGSPCTQCSTGRLPTRNPDSLTPRSHETILLPSIPSLTVRPTLPLYLCLRMLVLAVQQLAASMQLLYSHIRGLSWPESHDVLLSLACLSCPTMVKTRRMNTKTQTSLRDAPLAAVLACIHPYIH